MCFRAPRAHRHSPRVSQDPWTRIFQGSTQWEQRGRGASPGASEGSCSTGGTVMQQLTSGEGEEGRDNQLCSHFQLVGCNTALHPPDHLYRTPGSTVAGLPPKSVSVHLTAHTHRKKKDRLFIMLPSGFSLSNCFTLLPSPFCCLSARQAKFIQGCLAGMFHLQCSRRPCERGAAFTSPITELLGNVISHTLIRRVVQATVVKSTLEHKKTESYCLEKCQEIKTHYGFINAAAFPRVRGMHT